MSGGTIFTSELCPGGQRPVSKEIRSLGNSVAAKLFLSISVSINRKLLSKPGLETKKMIRKLKINYTIEINYKID